MAEALVPLAIERVDAPRRLAWAEGLVVSVPASLAAALEPFLRGGRLRLTDGAGLADVSQALRLRAAFTEHPPTSSRLPVSYQRVPAAVRTLLGRLIGAVERLRASSWARFPRWPIDLSSDFAADLIAAPPETAARTPVLLSHDLDTPEGLRNLVARFLDVEERLGARSTAYVVPCAWPIDHGLLAEVRGRGHEIGVHGYDHSNKTPFCDPAERRRRIEAAGELVARYAVTGYRAPSLVRTRALLEDLARLYRYDSSIPTSGGRFPVPNNGCATARPFHIAGLLEIPLTLPRDGSLRFLGHGPEAVLATWKRCAEIVHRSGGVVSLLTHCEARFSGNAAMLDVYRRFLEHLAGDGRFEFTTAARLAASDDA